MIVYISIGNSDDKLSQKSWSEFHQIIDSVVRNRAKIVHGAWVSESTSEYQNACWCIEFTLGPAGRADFKDMLAMYADEYLQDSIAWAEVERTEFITPGH